jgi:hypothetical protein
LKNYTEYLTGPFDEAFKKKDSLSLEEENLNTISGNRYF